MLLSCILDAAMGEFHDEEAPAAAQSLQEQAQGLSGVVSVFTLVRTNA